MDRIILTSAVQSDALYLQAVDNRCFYTPYTMNEWREFAMAPLCSITVARQLGSVIGFAITLPVPESDDVDIKKLAISPVHQHKGTGTKLMDHILKFAGKKGAGKVFCSVPESMCNPRTDQNPATWLVKKGFTISRIDRDRWHENNRDWDDFVFERAV